MTAFDLSDEDMRKIRTLPPAEPTPKVAKHAAESGHWYDSRGNQIETVKSKDGRDIAPTLVHARKLDLARGVTSIIRCAAAPQLVEWQIGQGILAALTLTRLPGESDEAFVQRVRLDGRETAAKAAEEGTRIHAAIQAHMQGEPVSPAYHEHVAGVMTQLDLVCGVQAWRSEVGVASSWGYGTKIDVCSDEWVLDFKGVEGDAAALDARRTYDEHAMQLAAGAHALDPRRPRKCAICFVSRTHPGVARVVGLDADAIERGLAMFRALLSYSFWKDKYRPSWAEAA